MPNPRVTLLIARAHNGVIGHGNALPWHIPEELQHFKRTTNGHTLIMGRLTFDAIGRPLPGRRTIVVSRNQAWAEDGCERADSIERAIALAGEPSPQHPGLSLDEVFVVGGAQIYRAALPLADRILLSEVDLEPDGDVRIDPPDPAQWRPVARESRTSTIGVGFEIVDYRRA
jgi:dihydrofolate reductase